MIGTRMIEAIVVFFSEVILSAPRAAMLAALAYPAAYTRTQDRTPPPTI
jgi:hypothetical protein